MQGLVVVYLIVEIWNAKYSHWVNVPAKSGGQGDVSCKV